MIKFLLDIIITLFILAIIITGLLFYMIPMPNTSFQGTPPALIQTEVELKERLQAHIQILASQPEGRNNFEGHRLDIAKNYIIKQFQDYGYVPTRQAYQIKEGMLVAGLDIDIDMESQYSNVITEKVGTSKPAEIIVIGAHYDTVLGSPGANDNGSGVAALLEIARWLKTQQFARTVRCVAFPNEEAPFHSTSAMGSFVYAKQTSELQENIIGMLALETLGYYSQNEGSQHYPQPFQYFYPDKGNFVAFVGNLSSRSLVRTTVNAFREHATIPSEGVAAPAFIPGVSWSDHWAFWQYDYPAIMVTDTAPFRYPHYHLSSDTADKINYDALTRVVLGLEKAIETLANDVEI